METKSCVFLARMGEHETTGEHGEWISMIRLVQRNRTELEIDFHDSVVASPTAHNPRTLEVRRAAKTAGSNSIRGYCRLTENAVQIDFI